MLHARLDLVVACDRDDGTFSAIGRAANEWWGKLSFGVTGVSGNGGTAGTVTTSHSLRIAVGPAMLIWIIGIVHVTAAVVMVGLVLLHSGKGGGVSDMFGGAASSTAAGSTVAEKNLNRITVVAATTFAFTTVSLGLLLA